jgi:hypothetical protein
METCSPSASSTGGAGNDQPFGDPSSAGNGGSGPGDLGVITERPVGETDCVAEVRRGEQLALDIYVLFDLSCSMNCNAMMTGGLNC